MKLHVGCGNVIISGWSKLDIEKLLSNSTALRSNELSELSKELSEIKNVTDLAEELDINLDDLIEILQAEGMEVRRASSGHSSKANPVFCM